MQPFSVNFAALLKRLKRHCLTFTTSECMLPRSAAFSTTSWLLFLATSALHSARRLVHELGDVEGLSVHLHPPGLDLR